MSTSEKRRRATGATRIANHLRRLASALFKFFYRPESRLIAVPATTSTIILCGDCYGSTKPDGTTHDGRSLLRSDKRHCWCGSTSWRHIARVPKETPELEKPTTREWARDTIDRYYEERQDGESARVN